MREYRLTRNAGYTNPNCPGHYDLTCRQGYYMIANSLEEALAEMRDRFPDDTDGFTVEARNTTKYFALEKAEPLTETTCLILNG